MRIALWITKATNAHSEYVIVIAFPLQQWLHEREAMLRYMYISWLVSMVFFRAFVMADLLSHTNK
jgi:hypothetical protein